MTHLTKIMFEDKQSLLFQSKVLNSNQIEVISKLGFLKKQNVYLGGGTALAIQKGHRTSVDLDFFSETEPNMQLVVAELQKEIENIVVRRAEKHTMFAEALGTDISLFYYPYKMLNSFVEVGSLYLASVEDIAAMKIAAIIQRGTRRDFIDTFYLLNEFSLKRVLELTKEKFSGYQETMALIALNHFKDAESEDETAREIKVFDQNFSWDEAKKVITEEVEKYQLAMLKKGKPDYQ